ncbi:9099_t:CDS:2, partial [Entrophospora sp. SA101]
YKLTILIFLILRLIQLNSNKDTSKKFTQEPSSLSLALTLNASKLSLLLLQQ